MCLLILLLNKMAINPILDRNGRPQMFPNEQLLMLFPGVYGTLELNNNYRSRFPGTLFLSNARIIFVNQDPSKSVYNFALHLNLIERENYSKNFPRHSVVQGYAKPYMNYMPSPGNFKFEMLQDPQPLISALTNLLGQIRAMAANNVLNEARSQAFVDPNDPDIIYMVDSSKGK